MSFITVLSINLIAINMLNCINHYGHCVRHGAHSSGFMDIVLAISLLACVGVLVAIGIKILIKDI